MSEPFVSAAWKLLFRWRIILCCLGARMLSGGGGNEGRGGWEGGLGCGGGREKERGSGE